VGVDEVTPKSGAGGGTTPVPEIAAVCGEPAALSATETVAEKVAAVAGVKVTEMVQLAPEASVLPQVVVSAKSDGLAPVMLMPVMLRGLLPGFETVINCAVAVLPSVVLGKVRLVGLSTA